MLRALLVAVTLVAGSVSAVPADAATRLTFGSITTADHYRGTVRATGVLSPTPRQGTPVYLQRYDATRRVWLDIGLGHSNGSSVTVSARAQGSYLWYRLRSGSSVSPTKHFQHFVWRGAFNKPVLAGAGPRSYGAPARTGDRSTLSMTGGPAWVDINTSGCLSLEAMFDLVADDPARVLIKRGTSTIASTTMTVGSKVFRTVSFPATSRLRLELLDDGLLSNVWLLCNNNAGSLRGPLAAPNSLIMNLIHQDGNRIIGPYGTRAGLAGVLQDGSTGRDATPVGVGGQLVRVMRSRHGANKWSTFMTVRTRANGWAPIWVTRGYPYDYAIAVPYPNTEPPVQLFGTFGEPRFPVIQRLVAFDRVSASGRTVHATGRVFPAPPKGYPVYLQRYVAGSGWRNIAIGRTTGGNSVSMSVTVGPSTLTYRLYAPFHPSPPYAAGAWSTRTLTMT